MLNLETGRIALLNRAAELLFGYTSDQALGLPIERLVPVVDRPLLRPLIRRLVQNRSGLAEECRILGASEIERWAAFSAVVIEDAPLFALLICQDVTDRKLAEARHREQARVEGMLRAIEMLGEVLDRDLVVASRQLQLALAERHLPEPARALADRAHQAVAGALTVLARLRRLRNVEDIELVLGPDELPDAAPVLPGPFDS